MKTKKLISIVSTATLLSIAPLAFGQSPSNGSISNNSNLPSNTEAFGKGTNVINVGLGLGGDYTYIGGGYTSTPNLVLSYDNGTFGNVGPGTISLGGLFSYKGASYNYTDAYTNYYYNQSWSYYILGIRSAYHWNFTTNGHFDPYVGLMLGYYDISYKSSSNDPYYNNPHNPYYSYTDNNYSSYVAFSFYIGARYYLSNSVGLWLELGSGYSNVALGVCFKF